MTENLLLGILAGIVIWLATSATAFVLRRYRLANALIEDLNHRISDLDNVEEYLDEYFKGHVKENAVLQSFAYYAKDEFYFFNDVRGDLYKYFGTADLIAVMRCYEALEEIEILMDGLSKDSFRYNEKQKTLSAEDVIFLVRRKERIRSITKILKKKEIRNLTDLPRDYKGMISAAAIIRK